MANPRKFSEKIALHRQRQAEEQASYERVLMEVRAVTQTPQMQAPCGGPRMQGQNHMVNPMLDRAHSRDAMRHMWSSMPNIHSAAQQQQLQQQQQQSQPPHQQQQQSGFYPNNNNQQVGMRGNNFQLPAHQPDSMFFEPNDNQINNHGLPSGQGGHLPTQNIFLEPPNWPINGPSGPSGMGNQGYGNGNLARCYSENNIHQSMPNIKRATNPGSNFLTNGQAGPKSTEPNIRERLMRLRPPETPQGAPCGSLPDLNKLVIPKNSGSRPSSAKSAGQSTPKEQYETKRRVDSPRVIRERAPSNPSSNVGSPRSNPRRPHPYGSNRLSWNLTGSSPSSPVSANISQRGLNSNSLPSSPQTPRNQDSLDNGFLKENIADCLNSPSPVPEIVLTPSDNFSSNCSMGMGEHPLQLSGFNPPAQSNFFSSVSSSAPVVNQTGSSENSLMDFTPSSDRPLTNHHSTNNPSMPSNFTFLDTLNSISNSQTTPQNHQPSHDNIPTLLTPNSAQLELLENGKLFDSL